MKDILAIVLAGALFVLGIQVGKSISKEQQVLPRDYRFHYQCLDETNFTYVPFVEDTKKGCLQRMESEEVLQFVD